MFKIFNKKKDKNMNYFKDVIEVKGVIDGKEISIKHGEYAHQASGAVTVTVGDTVVLGTAVLGRAKEGADFFPLMVDYQEKYYATGTIGGNRFMKREGRPSDNAVLVSRMIDRPIRPLFPKGITNEVQVICTVLSADMEVDPAPIAMIAASAALAVSGMPFGGPIGGVRIGMLDGKLVVNPSFAEKDNIDLDLMVAGHKDAITMVESKANEVSYDTMLEALQVAHKHIVEVCKLQDELVAKINPEKLEVTIAEKDEDVVAKINEVIEDSRLDEITGLTKKDVKDKQKKYFEEIAEKFAAEIENEEMSERDIKGVLEKRLKKRMRHNIVVEKKRIDGRAVDEIREIRTQVGVIPRTHGSGLFQRGETQVLSLLTLGSPNDAQLVETMDLDETKRYIHHYNFPAYSVGEVKFLRSPGRREIGHGDLAERALLPVLPEAAEFAYTTRVVSEVLSCNGSSSMASVCGSTLALMDAGVPIKKPVAGIAMGLVTLEGGDYQILSDIQGLEDFAGDMDFKVTGTRDGITALQMDIKLDGLSIEIMKEALERAEKGLHFILDNMEATIAEPRKETSKYAPMIESMMINPKQIGDVIGKGGETIQALTAETNTEISIEDDGQVIITAPDRESYEAARDRIAAIVYQPEVGDVFDGKAFRIEPFGALVEFAPGKTGLLHISELAPKRIEKTEDVVNQGDTIKVEILEVARDGKVRLSHKKFYKEKSE
jgi:polyribonucleotide nucleotidyltransferase